MQKKKLKLKKVNVNSNLCKNTIKSNKLKKREREKKRW